MYNIVNSKIENTYNIVNNKIEYLWTISYVQRMCNEPWKYHANGCSIQFTIQQRFGRNEIQRDRDSFVCELSKVNPGIKSSKSHYREIIAR